MPCLLRPLSRARMRARKCSDLNKYILANETMRQGMKWKEAELCHQGLGPLRMRLEVGVALGLCEALFLESDLLEQLLHALCRVIILVQPELDLGREAELQVFSQSVPDIPAQCKGIGKSETSNCPIRSDLPGRKILLIIIIQYCMSIHNTGKLQKPNSTARRTLCSCPVLGESAASPS